MTRRIPIAVALATLVLILLGLGTAAHADYDARRSAVKDIISKSELTEDEQKALTKAFDSYFDQRSRCLTRLIEILEDDAKEQAALWHARALMCQTGGAQTLGEALKDLKEPSKEVLSLINELKLQEHKFFSALTNMSVAEQHDVIIALGEGLEDMTDILVKKWYSIQESDKSIDTRLKAATERVDRQISDAMRGAADKHKQASVRLAEAIKAWASSNGSSGTDVDNLQLPLDWMAQKWIEIKGKEVAFATLMADSARGETRVIVMFNEVREDTDEFLEKGSFENARAAFQTAQHSANGFVGNVSAPGQKDDAATFRTKALDALTDHMEDAEDVWVKFVSEHEHRFFGSISPGVKDALVEQRDTDRWRRQLENHGLQNKLASWYSDAEHYFGVSFSGLTSEQQSKLKAAFRPHLDKYVASLKQMIEADKKMLEQAKDREDLTDAFDD